MVWFSLSTIVASGPLCHNCLPVADEVAVPERQAACQHNTVTGSKGKPRWSPYVSLESTYNHT